MNEFDEILRIQKLINESTRKEIIEDRKAELMALINSIVPFDKKIQIEEIFYNAMSRGFTESEIKEVLRQYVLDKILFQPEVGYIQRRN